MQLLYLPYMFLCISFTCTCFIRVCTDPSFAMFMFEQFSYLLYSCLCSSLISKFRVRTFSLFVWTVSLLAILVFEKFLYLFILYFRLCNSFIWNFRVHGFSLFGIYVSEIFSYLLYSCLSSFFICYKFIWTVSYSRPCSSCFYYFRVCVVSLFAI